MKKNQENQAAEFLGVKILNPLQEKAVVGGGSHHHHRAHHDDACVAEEEEAIQ